MQFSCFSSISDYGINSILYQRGIYPPENFTYKQQYGLTLFVTDDKGVNAYLKDVLAQIKGWSNWLATISIMSIHIAGQI